MKPEHVIVRFKRDHELLCERNGQIGYALVDYELLERSPEHEQAVRTTHRQLYLKHMARGFDSSAVGPMPAHLRATNIFGVDYVFGRAESTGGLIWVVGKDPTFISCRSGGAGLRNGACRRVTACAITRTKDNTNLVWKVSPMGEIPELGDSHPNAAAAKACGYNSPFEEFAIALGLARAGIKTVYARAIYMTGRKGRAEHDLANERRFNALANLRTPDGEPAVRKDYDYITIWGFWNGPDELLAAQDGSYYTAVNPRRGVRTRHYPGRTA
ncbi:MAG: hypothetical protein NZ739_02750 [Verrucomicrobiae bacterium]|nr:hypothetical protein [Verrucomicrobiae bacterium]MDW7980021.1 hypothetical protein [Verrucomicrobiales bacterium]